MNLRRMLIYLITVVGPLEICTGQVGISPAGGNIENNKGSVSFTIGQIVNGTSTGSDASINAGIQQPYEFFIISGVENYFINLSVYPNPASDYLMLSVKDYPHHLLSYSLFNSNGQLLEIRDISDTKTFINLSNYISSFYIIQVLESGKTLKSFKIIKY